MKEKIYTIPVTEAFAVDCECPVCVLEKRLEAEYTDYFLGPSLMEPDCRMTTNDEGFCRRHLEMLYNKQENRLGLGLTIETHLQEQLKRLRLLAPGGGGNIGAGSTGAGSTGGSSTGRSITAANNTVAGSIGAGSTGASQASGSFFKGLLGRMSKKASASGATLDEALDFFIGLECKCAFCSKLDHTMDRYMDVILYLWTKEESFRKTFEGGRGFCLKHARELLSAAKKYLGGDTAGLFAETLLHMQLKNLERVRGEVDWFTKKFDYRYNDAPWGNSKDALPRSIQKLAGNCDLK